MNIIWDFDGTVYNSYPKIINAFDAIINARHQLSVDVKRLEDLIFIDTKHCAKIHANEFGYDYEKLLIEIRNHYDASSEVETVFPAVCVRGNETGLVLSLRYG